MSSLKVAVIVSVSASLTIKSAPLLVRVTVGVVLSMVKTRLVLPAYAFPATSSPSTVTVWVPSLPAGTSQA